MNTEVATAAVLTATDRNDDLDRRELSGGSSLELHEDDDDDDHYSLLDVPDDSEEGDDNDALRRKQDTTRLTVLRGSLPSRPVVNATPPVLDKPLVLPEHGSEGVVENLVKRITELERRTRQIVGPVIYVVIVAVAFA